MKEKNKKIFGIIMIVIAAVITGAFLGVWAINLEQSYNSCSAELSEGQNYHFASKNYTFFRPDSGYFYAYTTYCYFDVVRSGSSYTLAFDIDLKRPRVANSSEGNATSFNSNVWFFLNGYSTTNPYSITSALESDYSFYNNFEIRGYKISLSNMGVETYTYANSIWFASTYHKGSQSGLDVIDYVATGYETIDRLQDYAFLYAPSDMFGSNYSSLKYVFYVSCVDVNGSSITFYFACDVNSELNPMYNIQLDYTANANKSSIDYSQGFNDGSSVGYDTGYSDGRTVGFNVGKQTGISLGIEQANSYSFTSLLGAVIDVPVNAFTSVFNFNILGVNMKDFLAGLLTICVVIVVIRFVLVK